MSLNCQGAIDLLPAYAAETLEPSQRRAMRQHLKDCRECLQEASRVDVGLLFGGALVEQPSSKEVQEVLAGVRAGIAVRLAERKLADVSPRPRRRGLIAAAAALVAFTLAFPGVPARHSPAMPATASGASRAPASPSLVPAQRPIAPAAGVSGSRFPADATIYDWNPGSGQPRVVWIVDRSLDI